MDALKPKYIFLIIAISIFGIAAFIIYTEKFTEISLRFNSTLPSVEDKEKRAQWIRKHITEKNFPFNELSDEELNYWLLDPIHIHNRRLPPAHAYFLLAQTLRNKNSLSLFSQDDCSKSNFSGFPFLGSMPLRCQPPDVQRETRYKIMLVTSALLGDYRARLEFVRNIYNVPDCCNYVLSVYGSSLEISNNKGSIVTDSFYDFFNILKKLHTNDLSRDDICTLNVLAKGNSLINAQAAFELFRQYYNGEITNKDYSMAYAWLLIAKQNGFEKADLLISLFENEQPDAFVIEGQRIARSLIEN